MRKQYSKWQLCPVCYQLIFVRGYKTGNHVCPEAMVARREAELDMILEEETAEWSKQVDAFWSKPVVQFEQFLLEMEDEQ